LNYKARMLDTIAACCKKLLLNIKIFYYMSSLCVFLRTAFKHPVNLSSILCL
jgi:hypothetical protein